MCSDDREDLGSISLVQAFQMHEETKTGKNSKVCECELYHAVCCELEDKTRRLILEDADDIQAKEDSHELAPLCCL